MVLVSLDASGVLGLLLNGGHSAKAGYLDGTFRQTGRPAQADEILAKFGWGRQFLVLNREPLEAYARATSREEVLAAQAEFI